MRYLVEFSGIIDALEWEHFLERVREYPLERREYGQAERYVHFHYSFYVPAEDLDEIESLECLFYHSTMVIHDLQATALLDMQRDLDIICWP